MRRKPKFRKLTFVRIAKDSGEFMSGKDAIVNYTYGEEFGGSNYKSYSLYTIEDGKVTNEIAWYEEHQLTALKEQNVEKALEMIEEYNTTK